MELTDYASVQDYLFGLKAKGVKFGIDRMRMLAAEIGHPELAVPVIHIAGTNGKGSTAAMVESILREAGFKVGLYSSPHLVKLGERVQVDRVRLTEQEILDYTVELQPVAVRLGQDDPDNHPSFFEFMTAMAFLQFARKQCDVAVVEVGLGGELDATNIVAPMITVITSIGLDHCEMLGHSLGEIASAKAGILKAGIPVVIGRLPAEAEAVIRAQARALDCAVISVRDVYGDDLAAYPETAMEGDHQRWNAATATLIAKQMDAKWGLAEAGVTRGLLNASWPARWERLQRGERTIILDSSHNPEGASALARNFEQLHEENSADPIVVVGVLGAARAGPLMEVISRFAHAIYLVVPQQTRACSQSELRALISPDFKGAIVDHSVEALFGPAMDREFGANRTIVVTGSIYLAGEVMTLLGQSSEVGEGHLQDF